METLPNGTVTFLFTDIEGSTRLAQQHPNAMPTLLARHHELLQQSIQKQNGYVFQIIGDAFCVAFSSAIEAVNAAIDAQICLHNETWSPAPVKVRMGIHTGTAQIKEDGQYSGYATLASTQRIMSAGHGEQILISGATRELIRDSLPAKTELIDLGEKRLKDLLHPQHLYQLNASGFPSVFPPLKTLDSLPNNLPIQLTSFIGREKEIAEVKQELGNHRLVTLTGSGGTGKTRLSLQVAAELLEKFEHGVWFVELAPLTDPALIPQMILSTIGVQEQRGIPALESLKEYLREKRTLIVLDNCEHLIQASANVVNLLLGAVPNLKVMASSREALGVSGEAAYHVPSLALPDVKHLPIIEQLSQYEAVRLFIDRALLVAPHFVVDQDNAPFIAQICYRLDGIPLAIELAAARVKMMNVDQISNRLDDRFRLLTGGARTALPRQQTLRALIDWSYDHLSENECLLFRRLSVFAGSWTLEAAEEICADDSIDTYDVLDLLTQLVNKSLVTVMEHSQSGDSRYRMLETIRQYAREKLLVSGGSETFHVKHLAYFVKLAEQAERELYRVNQVFWLNKLESELDNFRVAIEWACNTDPKSGLRLIVASVPFWETRGDIREEEKWLIQLLERYTEVDSVHARALAEYGRVVAIAEGTLAKAQIIISQSLELARAIPDKHAEAFSLMYLGAIIALQGETEHAIPILEQSIALYRSFGDKLGQATATSWLSVNNNDPEDSKSFLLESLKLNRELGNVSSIAYCLSQLGHHAIWEGDFSAALEWLKEAGAIYRELGDQRNEAEVLQYFGNLAYWQGAYQEAGAYYEEDIRLAERTGNYIVALWSHLHLAYATLRQGNLSNAKKTFRLCAQQFQKVDNVIGSVYAIEGLASLYANNGDARRAAQLFAWADIMRDKLGDHRPPVEQASVEHDLAIIRSQLDEIAFEKSYNMGRALTLEQAVALAMSE